MKAAIILVLSLAFPATLLAAEGAKYEVAGVVRRVDKSTRQVVIRHDAIPGYMGAMVMPFACRSVGDLEALTPGDLVRFVLHLGEKEDWIEHIRILKKAEKPPQVPAPSVPSDALIRTGSRLPPFRMKDANGRELDGNVFKGVAFAFTFIFTRCPSPALCPLLSQKFREVQTTLQGTGCRLLSISIDPDHDTPEALARYASAVGADPQIWSFATGTREEVSRLALALGADFWEEQGVVSHHLRTVVVGADGTVSAIYDGNNWSAGELSADLLAARKPRS